MKKFLLLLLITFAGSTFVKAQDTIVKKDGETLKVKVTEIGTEEIKFKMTGVADSPIMALKKTEVKRVVVGGQVIINEKDAPVVKPKTDDVLVKQDGAILKVNVIEIGTDEVKFRLAGDPDGPIISVAKQDIKTLKVGDQVVIDNKKDTDDVITKKDGSMLKVKVIDLGNDDVKFKLAGNPDGPTMTLKKKDIKTVKVDGQIVFEYKEDPYSTSNSSILDKTSDLKFHFFAPLFNHLAFSYEWMNKPGFNFEVGLGIIGVGVSGNASNPQYSIGQVVRHNPTGFYLRGGPKFLLGSGSDIEIDGARISHPLKGRYFQIEAILQTMNRPYSMDTGYSSGYGVRTFNWEKKYQSLVLNLIYGRQNIYGKAITVGYYVGFGYSKEGITTSGNTPPAAYYNIYDYIDPQRYSFFYFGRNFPLTFTWGFTVGWIHKPITSKGNQGKYEHNPHSQNNRSKVD